MLCYENIGDWAVCPTSPRRCFEALNFSRKPLWESSELMSQQLR